MGAYTFKDNKKKLFGFGFAVLAVTLVAGILIGYFGRIGTELEAEAERSQVKHFSDKFQDKEFVNSVLERINADSLRNFLKTLSQEPHIAASDRDKWLIAWIKHKWEEFGLDSVTLSTYEFLISYPDANNPNKIYLLDDTNNQVWTSRHQEDMLREEDYHENYIHAFNAYAPKGNITGELVYVNYGRVEDIEELGQLGVNLTGRIAIARYGKIFRGSKLINCQRAGAIGLILYSDPDEVAREGLEPEKVYPNTFFLPDSGIQRGSVCEGDGDPLSPEWPSIKGAYRQMANASEQVGQYCFQGMPGIPSQPIGYGDAQRLLELMGGAEVPSSWRGRLPGITYRLGPGFDDQHREWRVRLVVNNYLEDKESSNVIGVIRGQVEPDRYVIIGNHRDSWGYGAADPSSGTCALMEIARVMGSMVKSGWRPRRTIVFASWAVEEYGLEGSYEYVYDNINKIMNRAVANLNMDTCVAGPILVPRASPVMKDVFLEAIKTVKDPKNQTRTLYDFFVEYNKNETTPILRVEDRIRILGAGSDHAIFAFYAGVPAVYFRFEPDTQIYKGLTSYPVYHTGFDTFYLMDTKVDPGFKIIRSCAQLTSHMALNFGESLLLPLNIMHIFTELDQGIKKLESSNITKKLVQIGAGAAYELMLEKMAGFRVAASRWTERRDAMIQSGQLLHADNFQLRDLNDQLMLLERVFLLPKGLPGRPDVRHALFSPANFDAYGGAAFPGITDLLYGVEEREPADQLAIYEEVKKHLSDLMIIFHQAQHWLDNSHEL